MLTFHEADYETTEIIIDFIGTALREYGEISLGDANKFAAAHSVQLTHDELQEMVWEYDDCL